MYRLSFDMSSNPIGGASTKSVRVGIGNSIQTYQFVRSGRVGYGFGDMQWETNTLDFLATSTTLRLSFTDVSSGGGASGPALDNIHVESLTAPVPVPAAGFLMVAALGAMGLASRRGTKSA